MTDRETILGTVPGEALDQRIAAEIMTVQRLYLYQTPAEYGALADFVAAAPAVRDHALSERTPPYSSDLQDAWKIVEELNSRGWPFTVELDEMGRVTARTGPQGQVRVGGEDTDLTVPEAICKAALLATLWQ